MGPFRQPPYPWKIPHNRGVHRAWSSHSARGSCLRLCSCLPDRAQERPQTQNGQRETSTPAVGGVTPAGPCETLAFAEPRCRACGGAWLASDLGQCPRRIIELFLTRVPASQAQTGAIRFVATPHPLLKLICRGWLAGRPRVLLLAPATNIFR